ncbi:MAG: MBL fold metallo-hydrolase [Gemmatimonadales bacterium]|nr:MBL fold metallo-hydrolase [Gemmatimonadales bacterium]NIN12215.1 MBL fold metallo-hydrolase [Gemmatimonadales bacterium]NIN50630.1 MBL fold metallo-hydrolase [Gemmatimonadales bacterium]NIP08094.1 MBL fold metallo-hydrolase [Gemmatimonadales bacterium]NIR03384.1 MBL fold metallo-hydrolase [Gemmatimonadales bacterium]
MSLITTFRIGTTTCHALDGGRQRLDGGAMFGVVPKPLWERRMAPDERNRIVLALRCLLIEHDVGPVLVDTGVGNKESSKFVDIYGVENAGSRGPTQLDDALAEAGYTAADIRYVINTHLHFDHCGGNTLVEMEWGEQGEKGQGRRGVISYPSFPLSPTKLAFPNATYVVQRGELEFASNTNERTAASYLAPNFVPVSEANRWQLVSGEVEVLPGIHVLPTPGHVPYHQSVLVTSGGEAACFLADLVPTAAHLPLPWIMGYDLEPLVTLESKRELLARAEGEGWVLVFEHDPDRGLGRAVRAGKSYAFAPLDTP